MFEDQIFFFSLRKSMTVSKNQIRFIDLKYEHKAASVGLAIFLNVIFFLILLSNSQEEKWAGVLSYVHLILLVGAIILLYAPKKTTSDEFKNLKKLTVEERTSSTIAEVLARANTDPVKTKLVAYLDLKFERGSLHKNLFLTKEEFERLKETHTIQDLLQLLKETREERGTYYLTGLAVIFGVISLYNTILRYACSRLNKE